MWTCPVCQKEYDDERYICPKCQFDERKNCTSLVPLVPLSEAQLASLERMWKLPEPEVESEPKSGTDSGHSKPERERPEYEGPGYEEPGYERSEHVKPVINIGGLWEQASFGTSGFSDAPGINFNDSDNKNPDDVGKDDHSDTQNTFTETGMTPFQIQENTWFEFPMQKKLWYDFVEGTARIDWGYLHQYPLQFFKAYGAYASNYMSEYTVKGLKGILKESEISEQQMMAGGERLYNDLMFMYCSNISDIKIFTEVKKRFSKQYHDGYDQYRAVMLGIFLWRNSSEVRQANAFKAAEIFKTYAAQEYPLAKAWLSECYRMGRGVSQDEEQAKILWKACRVELRKMAENHNAEAQYMLGKHDLIFQRKSEARRWMMRAWANRCVPAGEILGDLYVESAASDEERRMAFAFYKTVSWHNMTSTMKRLASCYDYGWGVSRNVAMAEKYYYRALKNKEPEVMYAYGKLLYEYYADRYEDAIEYLLVAKAHGLKKAEAFLKEAGLLNLNRKVNEESLDWGTRREYNKFH